MFVANVCQSQFHCPDSLIYGLNPLNYPFIRVFDPFKPISATNPSNTNIPLPATGFAFGLALMPNINGGSMSPTLYSNLPNGNFCYWDGSGWIDTGHLSSPLYTVFAPAASVLGGCKDVLYNFLPVSPAMEVWKYTGNGPAVLLTTIPYTNDYVADIVADCHCNFYILTKTLLRKFDPNGNLLQTIPVTGMVTGGGGVHLPLSVIIFR